MALTIHTLTLNQLKKYISKKSILKDVFTADDKGLKMRLVNKEGKTKIASVIVEEQDGDLFYGISTISGLRAKAFVNACEENYTELFANAGNEDFYSVAKNAFIKAFEGKFPTENIRGGIQSVEDGNTSANLAYRFNIAEGVRVDVSGTYYPEHVVDGKTVKENVVCTVDSVSFSYADGVKIKSLAEMLEVLTEAKNAK